MQALCAAVMIPTPLNPSWKMRWDAGYLDSCVNHADALLYATMYSARMTCWALKQQGTLDRINARARRQLLVLVAELGNLQERIHAITLQTVQRQTAGPVLGVDTRQRQAHA